MDIFGFKTIVQHNIQLQGWTQQNWTIHYLTSERPEGFINYELQHRDAKQLTSASSVHVK